MILLISCALFPVMVGVILLVAYRRFARPARMLEQLGPSLYGQSAILLAEPRSGPGFLEKALQSVGRIKTPSPQKAMTTRRELGFAGFRSDSAAQIFIGIRVVTAALFLLLAFVFRNSFFANNMVLRIATVGVAGFSGYSAPSFILARLIKRRKTKLRLSLPDALDLLVICVEAGLGLDQSLHNVTQELETSHPELCEELGLMMLETRAGKRRGEALKCLADRTGEEELRRLVTTLGQSDRFGTSMAEALRSHSDFLRVRRRQEAEERAAKVGVKLVFPIFFFILPSMMIVSVGPGLLQMFKNLLPMMKNVH